MPQISLTDPIISEYSPENGLSAFDCFQPAGGADT